MEKTPKECEQLERWLKEEGYKKYDSCLTSSEDYAYFKAFGKRDGRCDYQIAYRFWDWRKYPKGENIGIDIVVIVSNEGRTDLAISYPNLCIEDVERLAKDFYKFCVEHQIT